MSAEERRTVGGTRLAWRRLRAAPLSALAAIGAASGLARRADRAIGEASAGCLFGQVVDVPAQAWAIVPGAYVFPDGTPSDVLADRLMAALELVRAGRAVRVLVSGGPDEVAGMLRCRGRCTWRGRRGSPRSGWSRTSGRMAGRFIMRAASGWHACGRGSTWRGRAAGCASRTRLRGDAHASFGANGLAFWATAMSTVGISWSVSHTSGRKRCPGHDGVMNEHRPAMLRPRGACPLDAVVRRHADRRPVGPRVSPHVAGLRHARHLAFDPHAKAHWNSR
jgi:hypothetical protein